MQKLKILAFFLSVIFLFLPVSCKQKTTESKPNPNFVFILVDDLGWKDVGFMGSRFYDTPNIDHLASSGMVFTNAYAACAVCSPTRASILTGRYPARIGITDWIRGRYSGVTIPADKKNPTGYDTIPSRKLLTPKNPFWMEHEERTVAEVLKKKGYATCHIGKWHLGPSDWLPETQGFDYNIGGEDYGQPPTYFDPYKRGKFSIESLPPRKNGEYMSDRLGDEAVRFINAHKDDPFYLNMCHYAVHTPLEAKEDYIKEFKTRADSLHIPSLSPDEEYTGIYRTHIPLKGQRNPTYAAMIKSVDEAVGKIMNALQTNHLLEKTVVVFFSDNGGHIVSTDNSPLRMGKGFPYEGGIREPLVISYPGSIEAGTKSDVPVISTDFFSTFCTLAGVSLPKDRIIDGWNLVPLLKGGTLTDNRDLFWHFPHYWWGQTVKPYSIIRSGKWKLIRFWEDGHQELYNLATDLAEQNNRVVDHPEKVTELSKKLDEWLGNVGARIPKPNPEYWVKSKNN